MTLQDDYQVRLESFCGPLDLLLYLIRQAEVDVHDIPISTVTDQYLALLAAADDVDIEAAGDFVVMAATLMEIKSRTIMPPPDTPYEGDADPADATPASGGRSDEAEVDPRFELVRQLMQYQRFRIASERLESQRYDARRRYPARPGRDPAQIDHAEAVDLDLEDAHVFDLFESYRRISLSVDFSRLGDHHVLIDDTPAAVYQARLLERLRQEGDDGPMTMQRVFLDVDRITRIGFFLAMLELVRLRRMTVEQEDLSSDIRVSVLEHPEPLDVGLPSEARAAHPASTPATDPDEDHPA